ncbi:MAG: hypothetical protein ACF8XB_08645, partial [Planctomycetota bacterium JB042]
MNASEAPDAGSTAGGAKLLGLALLVGGLALAAWRMAPGLEAPFGPGFFGANAARYSIAGRNYDRHGFLAHLGAPDFTPGDPGDRP